MARSRSESRSDNGSESKTPLIVALVFFVLATVILGVTTYLGFNGEGEAKTAAETAKKEKDEAVKQKDIASEGLAMYKVAMGTNTEADLNTIRNMKYTNEGQQVYNELMTNVAARVKQATVDNIKENVAVGGDFMVDARDVFPWDLNSDGQTKQFSPPKRSAIDQMVRFYAEKVIADKSAAASKRGYEDIQAVTSKAITELDAQTRDLKAQIEALPNKILAAVAKSEKVNQDQQKQFTDAVNALNDKQQALSTETQNLKFQYQRQKEKSNLLKDSLDKAEEKISATEDPFAFDQPKGKIIRRRDKVVEINLGSADNLKPGLRFSIQPSNTITLGLGSRLRETKADDGTIVMRVATKGSVEVVEVLGPHLSTARITNESDEIRDRILGGDLLYNSVWRKGASDHIALAGIFDMDADGVDDITTVVRSLSKSGIVVDAYWDFSTNKWVGELNERTQYLIEGYAPSVHGLDANTEAKAKMTNAIAEAKKQAKDRGMTIVKLREFFPRIGFDVNLGITDDRINQAAARYYQSIATDSGEGK
ncbi:MAG TPA: hypothetical protein VGJ05_11245 [Fimbriiglobus sp.]|jgi:hypothetical protein